MTRRTLIALVLAASMVLAGCSTGTQTATTAPTDDTTAAEATAATTAETTSTTTTEPTTTAGEDYPKVKTEDCKYRGPDDDDIVDEEGACLPFDSDTVYRRVMDMAGVDLERGPTITGVPARETERFNFRFNNDTFEAAMGIAPDGDPEAFSPGYATPQGEDSRVVIRYVGYWNDTALQEELGYDYTATDAEITAAHEFLHVLQFYQGSQQRLRSNLPREGVNREKLELAMIEGSSTFFETEYERRYLDRPNATRNFAQFRNSSAFELSLLGPYVYGERYTRWYLNGSTDNFEKIYDDPARSMEQVMHNYAPDEEPPKALSLDGEASSEWSAPGVADTKGELVLQAALRSGVSGLDAQRGAAGWGQDRALTYQNDSYNADGNYKYGYAWSIRFDNASEAAEFRSIFGEWLESKGPEENGVYVKSEDRTYRMVQVSDETVVVLAGHETFTTQTTVSGNTSHVVVEHTTEDQTGSNSVQDDDEQSIAAGGFHVRTAA